jgi:hypothetical protein
VKAVEYIDKALQAINIRTVYVPRLKRVSKPVLGHKIKDSGYIPVDLRVLPGYTHHHAQYCFSWFGDWLCSLVRICQTTTVLYILRYFWDYLLWPMSPTS